MKPWQYFICLRPTPVVDCVCIRPFPCTCVCVLCSYPKVVHSMVNNWGNHSHSITKTGIQGADYNRVKKYISTYRVSPGCRSYASPRSLAVGKYSRTCSGWSLRVLEGSPLLHVSLLIPELLVEALHNGSIYCEKITTGACTCGLYT